MTFFGPGFVPVPGHVFVIPVFSAYQDPGISLSQMISHSSSAKTLILFVYSLNTSLYRSYAGSLALRVLTLRGGEAYVEGLYMIVASPSEVINAGFVE